MTQVIGKYTTAEIFTDNIESTCLSQIIQMVNHEAFTNPVAIMPDTHAGKGSVIGFTMKAGDKIIPNVIGVDIGCGMSAICLELPRSLTFEEHSMLDERIRQYIPFGSNVHQLPCCIDSQLEKRVPGFEKLCKRVGIDVDYARRSLGSLGGGNHFIELCFGQELNDLWVIVHSGSRHLGQKVCQFWQNTAKKKSGNGYDAIVEKGIANIKATLPKKEWNSAMLRLKANAKKKTNVSSNGLEFLTGQLREDYLTDMRLAQRYASYNRELMLSWIQIAITEILFEEKANYETLLGRVKFIETVHNYVDDQDMIRKGAISAHKNELVIIPLNMRDGTLICEGKGDPQWNESAPHGAGRLFSRSQAKKELSLETFKSQMEGIFSTSICSGTLDEAPGAYKDASEIISLIGDTVEVMAHLKPIHNLKAI